MKNKTNKSYATARTEFITQWGTLGTNWGINRTMAQIHALLMISSEPLTTQAVMDELAISRGNANTNLRELVNWGLIRVVIHKGDRKDYFEAEKDVWKMFCIISRERKRREIEPAIELLKTCTKDSGKPGNQDEAAFYKQLAELEEFLRLAGNIMERVARSEQNQLIPKVLNLLGR